MRADGYGAFLGATLDRKPRYRRSEAAMQNSSRPRSRWCISIGTRRTQRVVENSAVAICSRAATRRWPAGPTCAAAGATDQPRAELSRRATSRSHQHHRRAPLGTSRAASPATCARTGAPVHWSYIREHGPSPSRAPSVLSTTARGSREHVGHRGARRIERRVECGSRTAAPSARTCSAVGWKRDARHLDGTPQRGRVRSDCCSHDGTGCATVRPDRRARVRGIDRAARAGERLDRIVEPNTRE